LSRQEICLLNGPSAKQGGGDISRDKDFRSSAVEHKIEGEDSIDLDRECIDATFFDEGNFLTVW
jgi:hypothetical protein